MSPPAPGFERLTLSAFGRLIAITGPAEALNAARERLPPDYRPAEGPPEREWRFTVADDGMWMVATDDHVVVVGRELGIAIVYALSDLEIWVGEHAEGLIFIHAGSVVHRGRAIILPGHTRYGKTTLTLALAAAGATYFSDEYAIFDAHGMVHPYRRQPSVRPMSTGAAVAVPPDILASVDRPGPVPLGLAALLSYDHATGWAVVSQTASRGVLGAMAHALAGQSRPVEVLDALTQASRDARFLTGTRGEAAPAARALLQLLED